MKVYEAREVDRRFLPMCPVYARIDGRNFWAFTRGMERPFDPVMAEAMIATTEALVEETHARIGYTQSDEISLVWLADRPDSSIFFDHRIAKMTSVLASYATAAFIRALCSADHAGLLAKLPHFDCRVFQIPTRSEATNVFLWRERDATKNAISMATRSVYSHKEIDHKSGPEMEEMLLAKGISFNDYPSHFKRGTFVRRKTICREFTDAELARIPEVHRPPSEERITRHIVQQLDMPNFDSVANREAVVFDGAEPATTDV